MNFLSSRIHVIKRSATALHSRVARGSTITAKLYVSALSALARNVLPPMAARRIRNSIYAACPWPDMAFRARRVTLGRRTAVSLIPHIGEYDGDALFTKHLDYEAPVFRWLEQNAARQYDLVIEIGANVGVYTVFFDALIKGSPGGRLKSIVAFEPSAEAYRRLVENLGANHAASVLAFNLAIGARSGTRAFFEPPGHLTNGSFYRDFAANFSSSLIETQVSVIGPAELESYFRHTSKVLVKIDAEGAEPEIIDALGPLIQTHRPDLLIEILQDTVVSLESCSALTGYSKFLITEVGLRPELSLFASSEMRDWLLRAC